MLLTVSMVGRKMADIENETQGEIRDSKGRFLNGCPGGSTGGIYKDVAARRLKEWATNDLPQIYERIWSLIDDENTKCTTKATLLLSLVERAAGKVRHQVDVHNSDPFDINEVEVLRGQKLLEQIDKFERLLAAKDINPKSGIVNIIEGKKG